MPRHYKHLETGAAAAQIWPTAESTQNRFCQCYHPNLNNDNENKEEGEEKEETKMHEVISGSLLALDNLAAGVHAGSAPTRLGPALPRVQLRKPRPAVPAGSGLAPRLPGAGPRRVPWRGPAFGGGARATAEAALAAAHSPCAPRLLPSWVAGTRATAWLSVQVFRVLRLRILRAAQRPHQRVGLSFRLQAERPRKLHLCGALRNFQTSLELIVGLSAFPEPPQF
ncbi:hypothetical protein J1605_004686 [Eschrichtius robustus]|uniref:Uncharacterized protein n=1 Tax=Eschrichtius robustus TaxID=9764 RepID=A0AB34HDF0_ESCRO|nr:hypothetical protein J1605_004686 [Eschrichtius robustus]